MKHGSHIMLQRLVRSTVSTEPRPCLIVLLPWLCSFSSLCAWMSRPGNTSSRCLKNAVSIAIVSSKCPWIGQSLTMTILPSFSVMVALISPTFSLRSDLERLGAVENRLPRLAHAGRAERVGLARPAKRRLGLLIRLQQRLVRPLRREGRVLADRVHARKHLPGAVGGDGQALLHVLDRRVHRCLLVRCNWQSSAANWSSRHRTCGSSGRFCRILGGFLRVLAHFRGVGRAAGERARRSGQRAYPTKLVAIARGGQRGLKMSLPRHS